MDEAFEIGDRVFLKGQMFRCVSIAPYRRRDGVMSSVLEWSAACAECGNQFVVKSGVAFPGKANRRCSSCKKPGVKA